MHLAAPLNWRPWWAFIERLSGQKLTREEIEELRQA